VVLRGDPKVWKKKKKTTSKEYSKRSKARNSATTMRMAALRARA